MLEVSPKSPTDRIDELSGQLESICIRAEQLESRFASEFACVRPEFLDSARNLIHYVALRQIDLRDLQGQLTDLGLSSLGSAEQHVLASVRTVQKALHSSFGDATPDPDTGRGAFEHNKKLAELHTRDLLGVNTDGRGVDIMVTLPVEAANDYQLVCDLIATGMDMARINCAHDTSSEWLGMIENIRRASKEAVKDCKILMDLAGPKLRTGELLPGPGVLRVRPQRDLLGRVVSAKRVRLVAEDTMSNSKKTAVLPVPQSCIDYAEPGDELRFKDTRGRKRKFNVIRKDENGLIVESLKRAYLATGTKIRLFRKETGEKIKFRIGQLPALEQPIVLRSGDTLIINKNNVPGEPARVNRDGSVLRPAHVSCSLPEVFQYICVADPVSLNDGKIEGTVEAVSDKELSIQITRAKASGSRLRSNRSINFPNSDLQLKGLTESDKQNLEFVVRHADVVGLSFVSQPADIIALQDKLQKYPNCDLGIVCKIETEQGFNDLPKILLATMRYYPTGIMIARGDLAVECGWERLAEIQEEMLWLCEAAHLPVIWATQVLEGKSKKGRPSRAEITDAAMSQRADCVMLNKGPHILAAIKMLDNILRRMQNHQYKKTARLRKLSISDI
jgi:pyruvate kinase